MAETVRSHKRRFQFSLRTLMLAVAVCAIPLAWIKRKMDQADQQRAVVERILANPGLGSTTTIFYEGGGATFGIAQPSSLQFWLGKYLPRDLVFSVVLVNADVAKLPDIKAFSNLSHLTLSAKSRGVNDDDLEIVASMTNVRYLTIGGEGHENVITDAGIKLLAARSLTELLLSNCPKITDEGIQSLRDQPLLNSLYCDSDQLTDGALEIVKHLQYLTDLKITSNRITDDGVLRLYQLTYAENFKRLHLSSTHITGVSARAISTSLSLYDLKLGTELHDPDLEDIARLSRLTMLDLNGNSHLTDAGIIKLGALKNLPFLMLKGTQLTDAGLASLAPLKLIGLDVTGTQVTTQGINAFKASSPTTTIYHD
jgi:hypothetical protein